MQGQRPGCASDLFVQAPVTYTLYARGPKQAKMAGKFEQLTQELITQAKAEKYALQRPEARMYVRFVRSGPRSIHPVRKGAGTGKYGGQFEQLTQKLITQAQTEKYALQSPETRMCVRFVRSGPRGVHSVREGTGTGKDGAQPGLWIWTSIFGRRRPTTPLP